MSLLTWTNLVQAVGQFVGREFVHTEVNPTRKNLEMIKAELQLEILEMLLREEPPVIAMNSHELAMCSSIFIDVNLPNKVTKRDAVFQEEDVAENRRRLWVLSVENRLSVAGYWRNGKRSFDI